MNKEQHIAMIREDFGLSEIQAEAMVDFWKLDAERNQPTCPIHIKSLINEQEIKDVEQRMRGTNLATALELSKKLNV